MALEPSSLEAWDRLAAFYASRKGKEDDCLQALEQMRAIAPDSAGVWRAWAAHALTCGKKEVAENG